MQMSGSCLRRLKAASNHWFMDLSPHAVLVTLLLLLPLAPSQCDYALSMPTGLVLRTVHKPFRDDLLSLKFDWECYLNCKCQACIGFTDYWFHVSTWSTQSWNHKKTWNMYKMGGKTWITPYLVISFPKIKDIIYRRSSFAIWPLSASLVGSCNAIGINPELYIAE